VFADDSSHRVVYDSGTRRVGVDGGETYTLTFGSRFATPAQASSVVSLLVVPGLCLTGRPPARRGGGAPRVRSVCRTVSGRGSRGCTRRPSRRGR
jgi:hypothetical protein